MKLIIILTEVRHNSTFSSSKWLRSSNLGGGTLWIWLQAAVVVTKGPPLDFVIFGIEVALQSKGI